MMNESKLNNRMLHLIESGFFGKQLLNENFSENMKVRIFQTFYSYWNQSKWILVDGIPGKNTANAINLLKKKWDWKFEFAKPLKDALSDYYKYILEQIKSKHLSDLKELNNIHNLRMLQAILCLSERTEVKPDGVMGPITRTAMKEKLKTDVIAQVDDNDLKNLIDQAITNVDANNMDFKIAGVEDAAGSGSGSGEGSEKASTSGNNAGANAGSAEIVQKYKDGFQKIIDMAKGYTYKYGTFNIVHYGKTDPKDPEHYLEFYNAGYLYAGYMGKVEGGIKDSTELIKKAKQNGFQHKGCWQYYPEDGSFWLFNCNLRKPGGKITTANAFRYKP